MKLRRKDRSVPGLSMAAMPDLIFTILFFFMIVTHMRENTMSVVVKEPVGKELTKVVNKSGIVHVYIGKDKKGDYRIQVDNQIITTPDQLDQALIKARSEIPSDMLSKACASVQVDKDAPMEYLDEVKMSLRRASILRINYCGTGN